MPVETARQRFGVRLPLIPGSDAHRLEEIGRAMTSFRLAEGTVAEIRKALLRQDGRKVMNGEDA
jgi:PHP family Zn ribbon phosphoesterase